MQHQTNDLPFFQTEIHKQNEFTNIKELEQLMKKIIIQFIKRITSNKN